MQSFHHSLVGFVVTILLTVQNISSVPSGKVVPSNKNGGANISGGISLEQDRIDCIASLPLECSGVLLSQRWLLTLSYCVNTSSEIEVKFVCKGNAPIYVGALRRFSSGHLSLLFLKREALLSRLFHFELPQNADNKQLRQDGFVPIVPKQTRELIAEPVFVDECPLNDEGIVKENICLVSRTKRSSLKACELATGLPVATLNSNTGRTVVALLERGDCEDKLYRERRAITKGLVVGKRITESDVKWIRKVRSIEGM